MKKMYSAVVNSPRTELSENIDAVQSVIPVLNSDVFEDTKIAVIGNGETAETIRYASISNNQLIGCERGFQGVAKPWVSGTRLARNFTAYDHDIFKENIEGLYDRLDTADTDPLILQPGLQVINAERDARFRLGEIRGKSEINGQGRIGIIGVENPYVIQTSDNLLPPFYEWQNGRPDGSHVSDAISIPESYTVTLTSTAQALVSCVVKLIPNTSYVFDVVSLEEVAHWYVYKLGDYTTVVADGVSPFTFTPTSATDYVIGLYKSKPGAVTFKKPTLTPGTVSKPFKPQSTSMLAFQTELHANPTDGSDPDVLFEQDGQYQKLAKWQEVVLDGSLDWKPDPATNIAGMRTYYVRDGSLSIQSYVMWATKYDGTALTNRTVASFTDSDQCLALGNGIHFSVKNTDSGIGADVSPTTAEIGAYFFGFKMAHVDGTTPFTVAGEAVHGIKCWIPIAGFTGGNGDATLPTTFSAYALAAGWRPYNILCRLAKEVAEPVVSEGSLTLTEGDNVVEVGTGIVLRERANPFYYSVQDRYYINNTNFPTSLLKYRASNISSVFSGNSDGTSLWDVAGGDGANLIQAYTLSYNFQSNIPYSVTYIKLDKSPVVPITGVVAVNEKAQLSDLTAGVAEALHGVSVLTMQKAEKYSPGWITPTLLNGAIQGSTPVAYKMLSNSMVVLNGIFVASVAGVVFKLPMKYRPLKNLRFSVLSINSSGLPTPTNMEVHPNGDVGVGVFGSNYISFDGVMFLAEQ